MKNAVLLFVWILFFVGCASDKNNSCFPDGDSIEKVAIKIIDQGSVVDEVEVYQQNYILHVNQEEELFFSKRSINDQPSDVSKYIVMKFYQINMDDDNVTIYLYKQDGKYYAELPYHGIWEVSESFHQSILNFIE